MPIEQNSNRLHIFFVFEMKTKTITCGYSLHNFEGYVYVRKKQMITEEQFNDAHV